VPAWGWGSQVNASCDKKAEKKVINLYHVNNKILTNCSMWMLLDNSFKFVALQALLQSHPRKKCKCTNEILGPLLTTVFLPEVWLFHLLSLCSFVRWLVLKRVLRRVWPVGLKFLYICVKFLYICTYICVKGRKGNNLKKIFLVQEVNDWSQKAKIWHYERWMSVPFG